LLVTIGHFLGALWACGLQTMAALAIYGRSAAHSSCALALAAFAMLRTLAINAASASREPLLNATAALRAHTVGTAHEFTLDFVERFADPDLRARVEAETAALARAVKEEELRRINAERWEAAKQAAKRGTQTLLKLGLDKTVETTKFVVRSTPAATKLIGDTLVEGHKNLGAQTQKMMPGVLAASAVAASVDLTAASVDVALAGAAGLAFTSAIADLAVADKKREALAKKKVLQELRETHQIPDDVSDSELLDAAAVAVAASEAESAHVGGEVEAGIGAAESAWISEGVGKEEEEDEAESILDSRP